MSQDDWTYEAPQQGSDDWVYGDSSDNGWKTVKPHEFLPDHTKLGQVDTPENSVELDPKIEAARNDMQDTLYEGAKKGEDPDKLIAGIRQKYGHIITDQKPDETLRWYYDHYKGNGSDTHKDVAINWSTGASQTPDIIVTGQRPASDEALREKTWQAMHDIGVNIPEGVGQVGNKLAGWVTTGTDALGISDDANARIKASEADDASKWANHKYDPNNPVTNFIGNTIGQGIVLGPALSRLAPFEGAAAPVLNAATEGAGYGATLSGGDQPLAQAEEMAVLGAGLRTALPFNKVDFRPENHFGTVEPTPTTIVPEDAFTDKGKLKKETVEQRVSEITQDWQNTPDVKIVQRTRDLPADVRSGMKADNAKKPEAVVDSKGVIHIVADNIQDNDYDRIPAIVYHEMLGHKGLSNEFDSGLTGLMDNIYRTNHDIRKDVADYLNERPGIYENRPDRLALATEEVLAMRSEQGRIEPSTWTKLVGYVRNFGRDKLGQDWRYTDTDIKNILDKAHSNIIEGGKTSEGSGSKYMAITWHGSPHDFDEFDHSNMGKGEGAQAFGWGTYLTDRKGIAEFYRDKLSGDPQIAIDVNGQTHKMPDWRAGQLSELLDLPEKIGGFPPQYPAYQMFEHFRYNPSIEDIIHIVRNDEYPHYPKETLDAAEKAFRESNPRIETSKGKLYEVDVPDDAKWIHWDHQPTPEVSKVFNKLGVPTGVDEHALAELITTRNELKDTHNELWDKMDEIRDKKEILWKRLSTEEYGNSTKESLKEEYQSAEAERKILSEQVLRLGRTLDDLEEKITNGYKTGESLYRVLSKKLGSDKAASESLDKEGIHGIQYLDQGSRNSGEGTNNYVVFHDKTPKILSKYSEPKRKVSNISADKLNASKDIEDIINDTSIKIPKGERISHDDIKAMESDLGVPGLLKKNPKLLDAGVFYRSRELLRETTQDVLDKTDKLAQGKTTLSAFRKSLLRQTAVQEWVTKAATSAGQALNAFGIKLDDISLDSALRDLDLGRLTDQSYLETVAQNIRDNRDNAASVNKAIRDGVDKHLPEDWITSWHYAAMLSGYHSLEHNVVGHIFGSFLNNVTLGLSGTAGSVLKRVPGLSSKDWYTLTDMKYRMYGYANTLLDSAIYKQTLESFKNNRVTDDNGKATWSSAPRLPGIITGPERFHTASYTFFGKAELAANLYQKAARQALREGKTGAELSDRISEIANNPSREMFKAAMRDANSTRFMGEGDLGKMLRKGLSKPKPDETLARLFRFGFQNIAPFAGIAEQKLLATVRYLPVLDRLDPQARAQWSEGLKGRQAVLTRYVIGMSAVGYAASDGDWLDKQDPNLVAEIPVLNLMLLTHKAVQKFHALNSNSSDSEIVKATEAVTSAVSTFATQLEDDTFMRSLGDYFKARSEGGNAAARYWGREAQSFVPYSAALRELTAYVDPVKRDMTGDTTAETVGNYVKALIPAGSKSLPARAEPNKPKTYTIESINGLEQDLKTWQASPEWKHMNAKEKGEVKQKLSRYWHNKGKEPADEWSYQ